MLYRLIILTGDRRGEHITVTEEPMTIGCSATCDVRIIDPEMAQTHAEIAHRPGGPTIHDLGSMNRILVSNREVRQAVLKHGDIVELGRTRFLVQAYVQAEVATGDDVERRGRWWPVAIGAAVLVLILLVPLTCHWRHPVRTVPAPVATPAPRIKVVPTVSKVGGAITPPSVPIKPPLAVASAPRVTSVSNAAPPVTATVATAAVATASAPQPPRVEGPDRAAQEAELAQAAAALADSKARTLLVKVRDRVAVGDLDEAERTLAEVFWFRPGYPPALEQRARLLERRGRLAEARRQWAALAAATNTEAAALARTEMNRLDAAREAARPPAPAKRVRIDSTELSKFPETDSFHEMRLLTVRLASVADVLPDTGAVKVEVVFYERDTATGAVTPAPDRGPREPVVAEGGWGEGEGKVVSASYTVPASSAADRARTFHGYVVRVFHHGVLQDAAAQPRDLLSNPASTNPAAVSREPAGRPGSG